MRDTHNAREHGKQRLTHARNGYGFDCRRLNLKRPQLCFSVIMFAVSAAGSLGAQALDANASTTAPTTASSAATANLPDAPSTILAELENAPAPADAASSSAAESPAQPASGLPSNTVPCPPQQVAATLIPTAHPTPNLTLVSWQPPQNGNGVTFPQNCAAGVEGNTRVQPIINRRTAPLTAGEKGKLAIRDFIDPFNLFAVTAYSGISIAINSHSAYGPGFKGFGKLTAYSLSEDAQGEFLGTFLIPVIAHEDPRYRREPGRPVMHRFFHAVEHTFVAEHDDGSPMPNYARLFMYPASAEISDLYVPGVQTDLKSTAARAAIGIATDPIGNIVEEFLPDVASHIHIHVLFFQEILNRVATGRSEPSAIQ